MTNKTLVYLYNNGLINPNACQSWIGPNPIREAGVKLRASTFTAFMALFFYLAALAPEILGSSIRFAADLRAWQIGSLIVAIFSVLYHFCSRSEFGTAYEKLAHSLGYSLAALVKVDTNTLLTDAKRALIRLAKGIINYDRDLTNIAEGKRCNERAMCVKRHKLYHRFQLVVAENPTVYFELAEQEMAEAEKARTVSGGQTQDQTAHFESPELTVQ